MVRGLFFQIVNWALQMAFDQLYGSSVGPLFEPQWRSVVEGFLSTGSVTAAQVTRALDDNRFLGTSLDRTAVALGVPPFMRHLLEDRLSDLIKAKIAAYFPE